MVGITKHADIVDVERRAKVFVSGQGYRSFWAPNEDNMIAQDDPGHAEQRSLVARRFTPKGVQSFEDYLQTTTTEIVDAICDSGGEIEVVDAVAARLPGRLTAKFLGWPEDRWPDIKTWSERMMRIDSIPRD